MKTIHITPDMADSVSQGHVHQTPQVAFCLACGKRYFVAHTTFTLIRGRCDCSWGCCEATRPVKHDAHIAHRTASQADLADASTGVLRDFRES
jgi:hypothetical protein